MAALPDTTPASEESKKKWPLPYYAVIFTSRRRPEGNDDDYAATAAAMVALGSQQPGYLGIDSHHTLNADGSVAAVTISYWTDTASIRAWRAVSEHAEARRRGKTEWYVTWNVRVAKVEQEYSGGWDGAKDEGE